MFQIPPKNTKIDLKNKSMCHIDSSTASSYIMTCATSATCQDIPNESRKRKVLPDCDDEDSDDYCYTGSYYEYDAKAALTSTEIVCLSDHELDWAEQLRAAVDEEDEDDLDAEVSDLEVAQHALAASGDLNQALTSLRHFQGLRRSLKIQHNTKHALQVLRQFMEQHPGVLLKIVDHSKAAPTPGQLSNGSNKRKRSSPASAEEKGFLVVLDMATLLKNLSRAKDSTQSWDTVMAALYYVHLLLTPDLNAMRAGGTLVLDCQNLEWNVGATESLCLRLWEDLLQYLPINAAASNAWLYNVQVASREACALTELCQTILSKPALQRIYLNCEMDGMADLFLCTDAAQTQKLLLKDAEKILNERFLHEEEFLL